MREEKVHYKSTTSSPIAKFHPRTTPASRMSDCPEKDAAALKQEYDKLSKEASSLASTLARRRADIALRRAEAATVAVSLESAKEQLDIALRNEALIRSNAQQTSQAEKAQADFLPDHGLIRALAGQLEVTRESVKAGTQKRASLRDEIHELESATKDRKSREELSAELEAKMIVSGEENVDFIADKRKILPDEGNTAPILSKRRCSSATHNSVEENALRVLQDSAESQSSFRSDHARIWRDVTMPNLTMVRNESREPTLSDTSLGVVTERIFEGVTCFTPTDAPKGNDKGAKEIRINSCGEVNRPSEALSELVSEHYGSIVTATKENGTEVRLIAPKVALERVTDLVGDQGPDVAKRRRPVSAVHDDDIVASSKSSSEDKGKITREAKSSAAGHQESANRRNLDRLAGKVSMRRSDPSEILTDEQFAHLISVGVPARFQESALDLVYSTEVHGISLHTLYHRAAKSSPTLVVIRDTRNRIFGCYATQAWKSSATRYYGSGESFVFGSPNSKTLPKVYKWSRLNSFFQFTSGTFLAIGGGAGSHFALWIDEDLLMGTTSTCSTFESPPLIDTGELSDAATREFKILSLEVWSFVAHRRH